MLPQKASYDNREFMPGNFFVLLLFSSSCFNNILTNEHINRARKIHEGYGFLRVKPKVEE